MNRHTTTQFEDLPENSPVDLSEFDDAFQKASANRFEDFYANIPDGVYDAEICGAQLGRTRTAKPMITWRMVLASAPEIRQTITKTRVITENTMPWVKEDLLKCGLNLSRLSDLQQRVSEMEGRLVRLEKKTINGRSELFFRWPERPQPAAEEDRDLPF